ncbi:MULTISPECIES: acyl carrier protein [unclassified Streptomyces]|jgi:acyl carrier protein|uniref:acyl carrier protein n=1 Tax=unclassified Streptomyces TaxID=2593676 RepID=UPI0038304F50
MQNTFSSLKDILVSKLKVEPESVTPDATREDVELDSLAIVELAMVLEKEFGIAVTDDELLDTENIGSMATLIEQRIAAV